VAERRRLREIELRLYYAPAASKSKPRPPLVQVNPAAVLPSSVATILDALKKGAIEQALGTFEEAARAVDPRGTWHHKRDGAMGSFLEMFAGLEVAIGGAADDGRACCIEANLTGGGREESPALLSLERGDSGLFRELRLYWEE